MSFRKGDLVTLFTSWDRKGTVRIQDLMVYSCGAKQMVLVNAEGTKFKGAHFEPSGTPESVQTRILPRMTTEQADAEALAMGAAVVAFETAHFNQRIAQWGHDAGFRAAMERGLAELHEPRALRREG